MPLDYTNPFVLQFLIEHLTKETERRIGWFNKNKERILYAARFTDKCKNYCIEDVAKTRLEPCVSTLALHHEISMINRRKKPLRDGIINVSQKYNPRTKTNASQGVIKLLEGSEIPNSIMKPIDGDVSEILYETRPDGGRVKYLKQRERKIPEERYYFCQTSNNMCGWKTKETRLDYSQSNRRCYYYNRDSSSRSGPHPDPRHYSLPLTTANFKCST